MAVETLYNSQREAAQLMGLDFQEIQELQEPRLAMDSQIVIDGQEVPVYRAHSGPDDGSRIAKGGLRMHDGYADILSAEANVRELSVEMLSKVAIRGHGATFMGGKGLLLINSTAPLETRKDAIRQYEAQMEKTGLAGHDHDVPAGDVGVGSDLTDEYANAYHRNNPLDSRWQAAITGKSPEFGGAEFRPAATGWGSYITQRTVMDSRGQQRSRTTIQGFGNVGGYHAYFASNDHAGRMPVDAISDADGIIYTAHPDGLKITEEMLTGIANNTNFALDSKFAEYPGKIHALAAMIAKNQPDIDFKVSGNSSAIISRPTDYFVPAAMGNVITGYNAGYLGARDGIIEASNGPTTPAAHRYLTERGLIIMPDIVANGAGVDGSIQEWNANLRDDHLTAKLQQQMLAETSERVVRETLQSAEQLGTRDMRTAAAGLGIARLFQTRRPTMIQELLAA